MNSDHLRKSLLLLEHPVIIDSFIKNTAENYYLLKHPEQFTLITFDDPISENEYPAYTLYLNDSSYQSIEHVIFENSQSLNKHNLYKNKINKNHNNSAPCLVSVSSIPINGIVARCYQLSKTQCENNVSFKTKASVKIKIQASLTFNEKHTFKLDSIEKYLSSTMVHKHKLIGILALSHDKLKLYLLTYELKQIAVSFLDLPENLIYIREWNLFYFETLNEVILCAWSTANTLAFFSLSRHKLIPLGFKYLENTQSISTIKPLPRDCVSGSFEWHFLVHWTSQCYRFYYFQQHLCKFCLHVKRETTSSSSLYPLILSSDVIGELIASNEQNQSSIRLCHIPSNTYFTENSNDKLSYHSSGIKFTLNVQEPVFDLIMYNSIHMLLWVSATKVFVLPLMHEKKFPSNDVFAVVNIINKPANFSIYGGSFCRKDLKADLIFKLFKSKNPAKYLNKNIQSKIEVEGKEPYAKLCQVHKLPKYVRLEEDIWNYLSYGFFMINKSLMEVIVNLKLYSCIFNIISHKFYTDDALTYLISKEMRKFLPFVTDNMSVERLNFVKGSIENFLPDSISTLLGILQKWIKIHCILPRKIILYRYPNFPKLPHVLNFLGYILETIQATGFENDSVFQNLLESIADNLSSNLLLKRILLKRYGQNSSLRCAQFKKPISRTCTPIVESVLFQLIDTT